MINTKQMTDDAARLGIKVEVAERGGRGYLRFEGTVGQTKKLWAAQGCDLTADHGHTESLAWKATIGGEFVGSLLSIRGIKGGYCYSYTSPI
jgi:hypothetical protein